MMPVRQPAYWFAGILFIAMGLGTAWLLARAVRFDCVRADGTCAVGTSTGFGWKTREFGVEQLRGARARTWERGGAAGMRLELLTDGGAIPLDLVNATGDVKDSLARVIEEFVDDHSVAEVRIREDARPAGWGLGLLLVAAGAICLAAMEWIRLTLDRDQGTVTLRSRRLRGRRSEDALVGDVTGVEVREFKLRRGSSSSVSLALRGRAEMPLTKMPMFTAQSAAAASALIRGWLDKGPR